VRFIRFCRSLDMRSLEEVPRSWIGRAGGRTSREAAGTV